jgi:hypothetical protein
MRASWVGLTSAVVLSVLSVLSVAARAQTPPAPAEPPLPPFGRPLSVLFRLGVESGGDKLGDAILASGASQTLQAGGHVVVNGGIVYQPADWTIEATLGYKEDATHVTNGRAAFARFPLDLIVSFANGDTRFGVGFTAHLFPRFTCRIETLCSVNSAFNHGMGAIVQLAFTLRLGDATALDVAARYTLITYSGDAASAVDGSGSGLLFGFRF